MLVTKRYANYTFSIQTNKAKDDYETKYVYLIVCSSGYNASSNFNTNNVVGASSMLVIYWCKYLLYDCLLYTQL